MLLRVDAGSPTPLAAQIAAQVRGAVARGEVVAGERLPSARELGASLEVNLHTVLRAYAELRDEGLLDLRRGRGAVVRRGVDAERTRLRGLARQFVVEARRQGLDLTEMTALVEEVRP
ncbi:GntR family transcriptional regulator [Rhodococcus aerolatus]